MSVLTDGRSTGYLFQGLKETITDLDRELNLADIRLSTQAERHAADNLQLRLITTMPNMIRILTDTLTKHFHDIRVSVAKTVAGVFESAAKNPTINTRAIIGEIMNVLQDSSRSATTGVKESYKRIERINQIIERDKTMPDEIRKQARSTQEYLKKQIGTTVGKIETETRDAIKKLAESKKTAQGNLSDAKKVIKQLKNTEARTADRAGKLEGRLLDTTNKTDTELAQINEEGLQTISDINAYKEKINATLLRM